MEWLSPGSATRRRAYLGGNSFGEASHFGLGFVRSATQGPTGIGVATPPGPNRNEPTATRMITYSTRSMKFPVVQTANQQMESLAGLATDRRDR